MNKRKLAIISSLLIISLFLLGCQEEIITERGQNATDTFESLNFNNESLYYINESSGVFSVNNNNSRLLNNGATFDIQKIKCSEFYNYTYKESDSIQEAYDGLTRTINIFGCVFSEFNQEEPELTEKILQKYDIEVAWVSFDVELGVEEELVPILPAEMPTYSFPQQCFNTKTKEIVNC